MATTLAVDGGNLVVRGIKATEGKGVELSADGVYTGHLYVCINMLSRYVREARPDRVVVCWDNGRSFRRTALYPGYKANRQSTEDASAQARGGVASSDAEVKEGAFKLMSTFLSLAGVHHISRPNVEADDLVAAYWRAKRPMDRFVILSGDRDFLQLLDPMTSQIRPGTNSPTGGEEWSAQDVIQHFNFPPTLMADVMALAGDPGDGIPGVAGVGVKTAVKLLAQYEWSLDRLLSSEEKKIQGQAEHVRTMRLLYDLRDTDYHGSDIPELPPFSPTSMTSPLWMDLLAFLDQYQLRTIKERLVAGSLWR